MYDSVNILKTSEFKRVNLKQFKKGEFYGYVNYITIKLLFRKEGRKEGRKKRRQEKKTKGGREVRQKGKEGGRGKGDNTLKVLRRVRAPLGLPSLPARSLSCDGTVCTHDHQRLAAAMPLHVSY